MQIGKNTTVTIDYTLRDSRGHLLEDTGDSGPVSYLHGRGLMIPKLEETLEGRKAGEDLKVTLTPEDAYGERDERLVLKIARTEFDDPDTIELGEDIQIHDGSSGGIMTVVDMDDELITLDGNHPFAGRTVVFEVSIREVRETTEEDLDALEHHHHDCDCGHDHGSGCCGGHGDDHDCGDDCGCDEGHGKGGCGHDHGSGHGDGSGCCGGH